MRSNRRVAAGGVIGALAMSLLSAPAAAQSDRCQGPLSRGCLPSPGFYAAWLACRAEGASVTIELGGCWGSACPPHSPAVSVEGNRIDFVVDSRIPPGTGCPSFPVEWCQWAATPPLPDGVYRVFTTILPYAPVEQEPEELRCGCYADCDGSGALDFFDFLCFQNAFAAGDPAADCDGSTTLDFFDFLCLQSAFAAGCP